VSVAAVVIWTPGDPDPAPCLESLAPQVDELVLVANPGGSPSAPDKTRILRNERTLGFGANINRGIAATTAPFVAASNPDIEAKPGSIAALSSFAASHPQWGVAGPQMRYPDGRWQPSRRTFPTVSGTIVRRTPLRKLLHPEQRQRRHYLLDERPTEPVETDTMLGAFIMLRRAMLDEIGGWDGGFRMYCEDIDLNYRAAKAGWERWYVPSALVTHEYAAVIDKKFLTRHTLWHARAMLRFLRKHPERLFAFR
jgi:GT2 family glycosyltransferase